jgi:tRNA nucleotidyltransferase/poly(A) polymerase
MTQTKTHRVPFVMELPYSIMKIYIIFKHHGYSLYVVGGAVRDAWLRKSPKDFDLATDALPDAVEKLLTEIGVPTVATGKSFGVINAFLDADEYEIATFREEAGYSDSRRPDEVKFSTIDKDVERRDLTMNALFYDIDKKEIVDLVGGLHDIDNGIVRTVGSAIERFKEDKLRKMRAVRFAARFGSELEIGTHEALLADSSLEGISAERIKDEFLAGIASAKSVVNYLKLLEKYELLRWVFRDLAFQTIFFEVRDPMVVMTFMLLRNDVLHTNKFERYLVETLKYSGDEAAQIVFLLRFKYLTIDKAVFLKKNQKAAKVTAKQILLLNDTVGIYEEALVGPFINFDLTLSGDDIMRDYNLAPGKEVGDLLYKLETENFMKLIA